MVWVGFKFGLGFWLATIALMGFVMALVCFFSWASQSWEKRKRIALRKEDAPKGVEWKRTSTSASRGGGSIQSFSFCSVIKWDNEQDRMERRHRDGVR